MNTFSRINGLCRSLFLAPVTLETLTTTGYRNKNNTWQSISRTPMHDFLDRLDKTAGIITRYKLGGDLAPAGERVRRLERHIQMRNHPPYFHLGADAERLALNS